MTRNINALCSEESGTLPSSWESSKISSSHGSLEVGLSQWKVQASSALRVGAAELRTIFLKVLNDFTIQLGVTYRLYAFNMTLDSRVVGFLHWETYTTW